MPERDRTHIFVRRPANAEPYRPRGGGPRRPAPRVTDPRAHGQRLESELAEAERAGRAERAAADVSVEGSIDGIYLRFESFPEVELALESLDPRRGRLHPELVSVRQFRSHEGVVEYATVFVPDGTLGHFLSRLQAYVETSSERKPKNLKLVERIRSVGIASIEGLWTDDPSEFPGYDARVWWEAWLRVRDGDELERFKRFADAAGIRLGSTFLGFTDRTVVLVEATASQLARAIVVLDDLAELRRPRDLAEFLAGEPAVEQAAWVDDLVARTTAATGEFPTACVVDTGVTRSHPLLTHSLEPQDQHACDLGWGVDDHKGHGTQMAGLALYGDLRAAIQSAHPVHLRHALESVKLLPPHGATEPRLWGAVSATAVSLVEIQAPARRRAFCLTTTAELNSPIPDSTDASFGQATAWSAALDALAAGLTVEADANGLVFLDEAEESAKRLFVVAAGNVRSYEEDHLARSDLEPVEDPAQAWNVLSVGAYTERDHMHLTDPGFSGWTTAAPRGELAPFSRTSVAFDRKWPIKPEVLFEGGNLAVSPDGTTFDTPDALQLLTTKAPLNDVRLLTVTNATSAATAQVSHLAATLLAEYPNLWPETVRALIIHSAEWTPAMAKRFENARTRSEVIALLRRYGMGVADEARALRSASDALTLVVEDVIHPFDGRGHLREMHVHDLPWPTDVLTELGEAEVRLRVTLSYFVEPNPGRRGWVRRYAYPSHGLRFEVRRPTEPTDAFRQRLNALALEEEEHRPGTRSDASQWMFGPSERTVGSVHSDIWRGAAAELADRGMVAVYPVSGWWKERTQRDHSERGARYALILSIQSSVEEVDIWTPVAQQIGIPIDIET
jgi:Subtilase family